MYAYIKGIVASVEEGGVILDNHDIGYYLSVPSTVTDQLSVGDEVKLHTYFSVREDAMQLYGFLSREDLELYQLLLGVNGIGPKGALGVLSVLDADELRFAVLSDDAATIAKAPGIGKKTAQKVIIELKDKLNLEDAFEKKSAHTEEAAVAADSPQSEATLALVALGYSNAEAMKAVRAVAPDHEGADAEALIKAALKELL